MANNVEIVTWQNIDVTPVDDALVYETAIGAGGIIYGCEVTIKNSNTLHINAGHAIVCGRKMTIVDDDMAIALATAGTQKGRLYLQLDLSNASTPAQLLTEVSGALTPPIQDENVNITNGTFEINLYMFDVSPTEISNLVRVANPLANILGNFAKIETRMVATKDYEIGDFMVKDNQLFKMLARVNSGDLFNIGGNVKKTTVGEEIALLNTDLATKTHTINSQYGIFYARRSGNVISYQWNGSSTAAPSSFFLESDIPQEFLTGVAIQSPLRSTAGLGYMIIQPSGAVQITCGQSASWSVSNACAIVA